MVINNVGLEIERSQNQGMLAIKSDVWKIKMRLKLMILKIQLQVPPRVKEKENE